ncbi:MAG: DUF4465 domain-containing protein [Sphingobacteriales bacterium]|nr:MAG: DUF4465 domain-containing protein [Sphingobacteriales bacterium]
MVKHLLFAASAACLGFMANAQTGADFENLTLGTDTFYFDTAANGYNFSSGSATLYGTFTDFGGGFYGGEGFTYSNIFDTTNCTTCFDLDFQYAAKPGVGYDSSENYAVAYAYVPAVMKLTAPATGVPVAGFMVANTTWGYSYGMDEYSTGGVANGWAKLQVRGFLNGTFVDSVNYYLSDYRSTTPAAEQGTLKGWDWVNLQSLGNVDSLTFRVTSANDFYPSYFAMDNFVTMEDGLTCSEHLNLIVSDIDAASAKISWNFNNTFGAADSFEVVINQSAAVAGTDVVNTITNSNFYDATGLTAAEAYYAHVRAFCYYSDSFTTWQHIPFTTAPSSVKNVAQISVQLYPNPTANLLYIDAKEQLDVMVVDMSGNLLINKKNVSQIDLSKLAAGQYLVKLSTKDGKKSVTKAVVKK